MSVIDTAVTPDQALPPGRQVRCPFGSEAPSTMQVDPDSGFVQLTSGWLGRDVSISPAAWRLITALSAEEGPWRSRWRKFATELLAQENGQEELGLHTLARIFPEDFEGHGDVSPLWGEPDFWEQGGADGQTAEAIATEEARIADQILRRHGRSNGPVELRAGVREPRIAGPSRRRRVGAIGEMAIAEGPLGGGSLDKEPAELEPETPLGPSGYGPRRYGQSRYGTDPRPGVDAPNEPVSLEDREFRLDAARATSALPEVLTTLAGDADPEVREGVAHNGFAPSDALSRLAADPVSRVRQAVAGNHTTPSDVLERLARDRNHGVRRQVAGNPKAPPTSLVDLVGDDDPEVRTRASINSSTPHDVQSQLAARRAGAAGAATELTEGTLGGVDSPNAPVAPSRIATSTPSSKEHILIRPVDRAIVRKNVETDGQRLVDLADLLLGQLDAVLEARGFGDNHPPIGEGDGRDARPELEGLRDRLRDFRAALAAAITAPERKIKPVITEGGRLLDAVTALNGIDIVRVPVLAASALGISLLAHFVGIPVTPDVVMATMVGANEGARALAKRGGKGA